MSKKMHSSWMQRHVTDVYVKKARQEGYRSRAAFKLLDIDKRDSLLRPGMTVVDLGAAPGGWSQVAAELVGPKGAVIALDILEMDSLPGVEFIHGDFREDDVLAKLLQVLDGRGVDLVISDMAPNISGMRVIDQPRSMYLAKLALDFARKVLKPGGDFLTKIFEGNSTAEYRKELQANFDKLLTRKPDSSRSESREIYLLAKSRIVPAHDMV